MLGRQLPGVLREAFRQGLAQGLLELLGRHVGRAVPARGGLRPSRPATTAACRWTSRSAACNIGLGHPPHGHHLAVGPGRRCAETAGQVGLHAAVDLLQQGISSRSTKKCRNISTIDIDRARAVVSNFTPRPWSR